MGKNDTTVLLEDMNSKMDTVLEIVGSMNDHLGNVEADVARLKDDVAELKSDVKTVKAVLIETNTQVQGYEQRVITLEAA